MEKLTFNENASGNPQSYEEKILDGRRRQKHFRKSVTNNAGLMIAVMMVFVAIIFLTTDVHLGSFVDVVKLSLTTLMILWCTYFTYVACSDSGNKAGLASDTYTGAVKTFNEIKKRFVDAGCQARLPEFCRHYVTTELEDTRRAILMDADVPYMVYLGRYVGRKSSEIYRDDTLTFRQKRAVIRANATKPIRLTPNMILQCGHASGRRNPLGISPDDKRHIQFAVKLLQSFLTSVFAASIVVDAILNPSWGMFVTVAIKVSMIILNGYFGYKFGFENVVFDTVHYMEGQQDLMRQTMTFCEKHKIES